MNAIRGLSANISFSAGLYCNALVGNKNLRASLYLSRKEVNTSLKEGIEASSSNILTAIERLAASIKDSNAKMNRHGASTGGTSFVSRLRTARAKDFKKMKDLLNVYNTAIAAKDSGDVEGVLVDLLEMDTDEEGVGLQESSTAVAVDVAPPSFATLTVRDVFERIE
ncbi:UNVERIFIED_CONTAM: hypothetical protein HDU68_009125 [Siphonaria sp. JEL0065]|nr:hypothetical protein HDU68_009125 [Siphonaria sp. JEL0065]